ncbi:MAG: periplasmic binding protein/LacI transcriptional regulator [Herbinix sp.]|jgi:ribose transport system substrate-binding protein|nr:periplasmic binding protein/LacI transcriptional regulator [Herbinix sp.]
MMKNFSKFENYIFLQWNIFNIYIGMILGNLIAFQIKDLRKQVMMKLKRIIINISVISFAFLLFCIWYQKSILNTSETTSSSLIKYYKVYLVTTDKEYQYWDYVNKGAADLAAAIGINYSWDAPAVRDVNKQIEIINNAVDDGADALLVAADDPKRISGVIEDAKARGVKIIYVDSPAYEEAITTLATNNYEAGVVAGQTMISTLENMGINSGSIGIISVVAKENSNQRERGFRKTLETDGRYTLLETIYTNGEPTVAQEAAEFIINENRDLVGLFGTNEGTSVGVGNAIKANENRFVGIGFDETDVMLKLLEEGSLKAIIVQNPYTMGYLGMAEAVAAILGKDTGPTYINTGVSVLE